MTATRTNEAGRPRRRTGLAVGLAAGVLGGGGAGLLLTMPSLTSATSDPDTAIETVADEVDERPDPGTQLRAALDELVVDGTITAEQADAVAEHLMAHRAEHRSEQDGRRGGHRGGDVRATVQEVLGLDAETIRDALADGSSLADLAEANGIDPQDLIDALVAEVEEHLATAVEDGRLTDDEAAEHLATAIERIEARVNDPAPPNGDGFGPGAGPGAGHGPQRGPGSGGPGSGGSGNGGPGGGGPGRLAGDA